MILVTGASGNVGKEVLKQMAHIGVQVRATFQSPSSVASAPSGVEIAIMDYNKPETIRAALQGVQRVFLVGPPTQKLAALERQAMDQIKQSEVQHVVKLSDDVGREIRYLDLPSQQFQQALLGAGLPEWSADALVNLQDFYRAGKASSVTSDVEQLLRRRPTSFEQFSRDYRDAFRKEERAAG